MHTADRRAGGPRSRWSLAIAGVTLLVVSVVMMATGAQPSRAQTARPAAGHLVSLRLPAPTGRYQVGTVALHLIDKGRANPWGLGASVQGNDDQCFLSGAGC
jgi:hypothetical protein